MRVLIPPNECLEAAMRIGFLVLFVSLVAAGFDRDERPIVANSPSQQTAVAPAQNGQTPVAVTPPAPSRQL
jgi:hypothetical protein